MPDDDLTVGELLDGLSLWDEMRPQNGGDWVKIAERFVAAGDTTEKSSALFAGLVLAVRQRDKLEAELFDARRMIGLYAAYASRETHEKVREAYNRRGEDTNA